MIDEYEKSAAAKQHIPAWRLFVPIQFCFSDKDIAFSRRFSVYIIYPQSPIAL